MLECCQNWTYTSLVKLETGPNQLIIILKTGLVKNLCKTLVKPVHNWVNPGITGSLWFVGKSQYYGDQQFY